MLSGCQSGRSADGGKLAEVRCGFTAVCMMCSLVTMQQRWGHDSSNQIGSSFAIARNFFGVVISETLTETDCPEKGNVFPEMDGFGAENVCFWSFSASSCLPEVISLIVCIYIYCFPGVNWP